MLDNDFIRKVKEANDIVDVIGESLTLYKAGINYKAVCPFHNDHTPSLVVSKTRQTYHCFVCGKHGSVVDFVMENDNLSFIEAMRYLAKRANIEWPHQKVSDEEMTQYKKRESQLVTIDACAKYYVSQLHQAESFLQKRGYTASDSILALYGVGYAPAGSVVAKTLPKQGYNSDLLTEVGVTAVSQEHGDTYDVFRDRLMFPFFDLHGKVIGFSGRQVTPNDRSGKYVNTGETPLFTKGRNLYGLFQARKAIAQRGFVYLVEGQFDVISLARYGVTNVIGGSGTAFTDDQLRLISRFTTEVRVIYDADTAGIKAAAKNTAILLKAGLKVKCIRLPKDMDPDNFAVKHKDDTGKLLLDMVESFPYAFRRLLVPRGCKDEVVINDALNTIASMIASVGDATLRLEYMKTLAKDFDTKIDAIDQKVREIRSNLPAKTSPDLPAGLYGIDQLKEKLEPDQPAVLTSDMQDFMQRLDDEPVVLVSGIISDPDVMKLRSICGYFTAAAPNIPTPSSESATVPDSFAVGQSPLPHFIVSLAKMFRLGITKITMVDGEQVESFLDYYIRQMGAWLHAYNGDKVEYITQCIELTTYAEDAVVSINRSHYCQQLGITKGSFDDIRKPLLSARKAAMKVNIQTDAIQTDALDSYSLPSYVDENPEYAEMYKQYQYFPLLNKQGEPVCYMFDNKNGEGRSIVGDFYMTPLLHIFSDDFDRNKRILKINRRYYNTPIYIEVTSRQLLKMSTIEDVLINYEAVNFTNGEEWKWKKIKEYMSRHYTMCSEIEVYGNQQSEGISRKQDEQFFAFANGIAHFVGDDYIFEPVNELGVVTHNGKNYYLPAFSTIHGSGSGKSDKYENISQLVYREVPKDKRVTFSEWADLMNRVYKLNDNGKWAIIFAVLCAFRSNIHCIDRLFTAPFFMGPMSSGKTQIAVSIRSIFIPPKFSALNLCQDTDMAVIKYMSVFRDVPVVLEEYDNVVTSDIKFQALKSIVYDGESRKKSKANTSKEVESDKVYAPVIICGQDVPQRNDNALMSRVIVCEVPKPQNRTREEIELFNRLKKIEDPESVGLSNVLLRILKLRPVVMDHFRALRQKGYEDLKAGRINSGETDRLMKTVSLFVGMVYLLEEYAPDMKLPFTSAEFLAIARNKIDEQLSRIRTSDKLALFFSAIDTMLDSGQLIYGRDLDVVSGNGKVATIKDASGNPQSVVLDANKHYMYLRLQPVFNIYNRSGFNTEKTTQSTIEQNMRSHTSFIGSVNSRRFKWTEAVEEADSDNKMVRMMRPQEKMTSAILIDYEEFTRLYNIDLRRNTDPSSTSTPSSEPATVPGSSAAGQVLPFDPAHPEREGIF